jgi:hypothetical protein
MLREGVRNPGAAAAAAVAAAATKIASGRRTRTLRTINQGVRGKPVAFWIDVAVKAALLGLLLFSVAFSHLPQFEGKAMGGRALAYPIATAIVPVAWWLVRRRRDRDVEYPYAADVLLVLPFLVDTLGNTLDLYDSISWWDDANHLVNWGLLTAAFGQVLLRLPLGRLATAAHAIGFGAVTAVLWEFGEYVTFIRNSPELETAYTDTLGDMALGLTGSVAAAAVTATLLWTRRRSRTT